MVLSQSLGYLSSTSFPGAAAQLCLFTSEPKKNQKEWKESKNTQNISLDGCYLLFEEYLQEKNMCLYPETFPKIGQSLEESLRGAKLVN